MKCPSCDRAMMLSAVHVSPARFSQSWTCDCKALEILNVSLDGLDMVSVGFIPKEWPDDEQPAS